MILYASPNFVKRSCKKDTHTLVGLMSSGSPQKKRQAQMKEQMGALKSGDKVITAGGIHGLVTNVKERSVTLKVADNVKIEFEKASITTVIKKDGGETSVDAPPAGESLPNNG